MRILTLNSAADCRGELERIGVDPAAFPVLLAKREALAVRLESLPSSAANILKQTALALGADVAMHRDVVRGRIGRSDAVLFANRRQIGRICERLKEQPPASRAAGVAISDLMKRLDVRTPVLRMRNVRLDLSSGTRLMGILNITPDSFSDGGEFLDPGAAVAHGLELAEHGADIIDIGAESTRPGAKPVSAKQEIARLMPVLNGLRRQVKTPISIDTYKSEVADACLAQGATMINDISGLRFDPKLARVISRARSACVVMHIRGRPRTMQKKPAYQDLMREIHASLEESVRRAVEAGVARESIVVDPGIGFGKSVEDNFTILRRLSELRSFGLPVMVGPSRKSFIGQTLDLPAGERLEGTLAACVASVLNGARILRVHDVKAAKRAVAIADQIAGDRR